MKNVNEELARDFPGTGLRHISMNNAAKAMNDLEKDIETALAEFNPINKPRSLTVKEPTLMEQLDKMGEVQRRLRERVRTDKMNLLQEHDRAWTQTQQDFARKIHDEVTKLERARDEALKTLADDYHEKSRELDFVAARLAADI
jgi:hypothetical protein